MLQKSYHTKTADLISQFIQTKDERGFTAGELSVFLKEHGLMKMVLLIYQMELWFYLTVR